MKTGSGQVQTIWQSLKGLYKQCAGVNQGGSCAQVCCVHGKSHCRVFAGQNFLMNDFRFIFVIMFQLAQHQLQDL